MSNSPSRDPCADHVQGKLCVFLVELLCYHAEVRVHIYSHNTLPLEELEDSLEEDRTPKDDFTKLFEQVHRLFLSAIQGHVNDPRVIGGELKSRLVNVCNDIARLHSLSLKSQELFNSISGDDSTSLAVLRIMLAYKTKEMEALAAVISAGFQVLVKDYQAMSLVCCRDGYRRRRII